MVSGQDDLDSLLNNSVDESAEPVESRSSLRLHQVVTSTISFLLIASLTAGASLWFMNNRHDLAKKAPEGFHPMDIFLWADGSKKTWKETKVEKEFWADDPSFGWDPDFSVSPLDGIDTSEFYPRQRYRPSRSRR